MSKLNLLNRLKNILPYISTLILVGCMTITAEITGEREIIFPEITALAIGYLVAEKRSWNVNGKRMLMLIAVCSVVGVLTVRYLKIGMYFQILIAFAVSQILFMLSGTSFAPMISAIVLPVMMQTESFVYPIAAILLTLAVILFRELFIGIGIRNREEYVPAKLNSKGDIADTAIRTVCVAVMGGIALLCNFKFAIAPPLLVAFTEFSRPNNKVRNKPVKAVPVITACAFFGAASRYLFNITLGLPLTFAALIATVAMLATIRFTNLYMPPVGAITILSMLIPSESVLLYPLQIFVGSTVIMLFSRVLFRPKR